MTGPPKFLAWAQRLLEGRAVVAVDRADVLEAEVLEHALRRERILEALLDRVQGVVERRADELGAVEPSLDLLERLLVARVGAQARQVVGQAADGRACRSGRCR